MPKNNPTNPHSTDTSEVEQLSPVPVRKAVVTSTDAREGGEGGAHGVMIRVYGDPSQYYATVLSPSRGDVNVPREGNDVAVAFGRQGKPYIIGYWYPRDKIEDGRVNLPDYKPGERIIGTPLNNSFISIRKNGTIQISTDKNARVDIDHNSFVSYMGSDQSVAGDSTYYVLEFNTEEDDPEDLFDTSTHEFTTRHDGRYKINAAVEVATPGQNNLYQIAIFVNDSEEKRVSRQSAVNEPLTMDVELNKRLNSGDVVDARLSHNRGSATTVQGTSVTTNFSAERHGI